MPNFTSVFSADSWRRKFEEARISDLNYELGKWAQESKNKLSHRLRLGNSPSSGSSWHSNRSAVPKSTSVSGVNLQILTDFIEYYWKNYSLVKFTQFVFNKQLLVKFLKFK